MTSQKWIYDPPPPPPAKATAESTRTYGSQRPVRGNSGFGGGGRGRGAENAPGRGNFHQGTSRRQSGNSRTGQGFGAPIQGHGVTAGFQQGSMGQSYGISGAFTLQQQMWNGPYQHQFPSLQQQQQQQFYPPNTYHPQYAQSQPFFSSQPLQSFPLNPHLNHPSQTSSLLPQSHPHQNSQGYTLSSTAYTLPSHHYKPSLPTPSHNALSEDELRYLLEQQMKKLKPSLPIEGTNVKLNTVEDIMEWRETRRKRWLSKIAAADGPKKEVRRGRKRTRGQKMENIVQKVTLEHATKKIKEGNEDKDKEISNDQEEDKRELSEGEIHEPRKQPRQSEHQKIMEIPEVNDNKDKNKSSMKGPPKKNKICVLWRQGKCRRGKKCLHLHQKQNRKSTIKDADHPKFIRSTNIVMEDENAMQDSKPKSLYAALLEKQMEREGIVLLQVLVHFREQGLLRID